MNVLVFASRKGGSGKSTLAAHLAAHVHRASRPCLLVDDDPQGSLSLWNELRKDDALPLKTVKRSIADILKKAKQKGVEWVFIDTPPNLSVSVADAIQSATLVIIPCRPGVFDLDAVQETIDYARGGGNHTPWSSMARHRSVRKSSFLWLLTRENAWLRGKSRCGAARLPTARTSLLRSPKVKARKNTMLNPIRLSRSRDYGSLSKNR